MVTINLFEHSGEYLKLSNNNHDSTLRINSISYKSPSNYIYSNLLGPNYRHKLFMSNPKNINNDYNTLLIKEVNEIKRIAYTLAYETKILNNDAINDILIDTDNLPIHYISNDTILGINEQGIGENIIGKILMQIRHQIFNTIKKIKDNEIREKFDDNLYNTYITYMGLQNRITNGSELTEYIDLSIDDIINKIGKQELSHNYPNKKFIVEELHDKKLINKDIYLVMENDNILAALLRKNNLRSLRNKQILKKCDCIFDMYTEYTIKKEYPKISPDKYKITIQQNTDKFIKDFGIDALDKLKQNVCELFDLGQLSASLSDKIDVKLRDIPIPDIETIEEAESYEQPVYSDIVLDKINIPYIEPSGIPIKIYPLEEQYTDETIQYYVFSPLDDSIAINIDQLSFPTILHVVFTNLIAFVIPTSLTKAYSHIVKTKNPLTFYKFDELLGIYTQIYNKNTNERKEKFMKQALDEKFKNIILQNLLVETGNAHLVWNDPSDSILGSPENIVGKYLMELRQKFKLIHNAETIEFVKIDDLDEILKDDSLYSWVNMRIRDMCKVITIMKKYMDVKTGTDIPINDILVTSILDNIYNKCSLMFSNINKITSKIPPNFEKLIKSFPGFGKIEKNVCESIWKRIAIMIHTLIKFSTNYTKYDIKIIIASLEEIVTKGGKCVDIIKDTQQNNCIASALVNIISGISIVNKKLDLDNSMDELEVETATQIILNTELKVDITPKDIRGKEIWEKYKRGKKGKVMNDKEYQDFIGSLKPGPRVQPDTSKEIVERDSDSDSGSDYSSGSSFGSGSSSVGSEDEDDDDFEHPDLIEALKIIDIHNPVKMANFIIDAIPVIKVYKPVGARERTQDIHGLEYDETLIKVGKNRINRINFFATQES